MTAGSFKSSLERGTLSLSVFHTLVLDECHNAVKSHDYVDVLEEVIDATSFD
jgi:ERCC4-related helicase